MERMKSRVLALTLAVLLISGLMGTMPLMAFSEEPGEGLTGPGASDEQADTEPGAATTPGSDSPTLEPLANPPGASDICMIVETNEGYETFVDALNAVNPGETIKLLENINELTSAMVSDPLTIDLNGFALTLFTLECSSDLTIEGNGAITVFHAVEVNSGGTLIANADISSTGPLEPAIRADGAGTVVIVNGNVSGYGDSSAGLSAIGGALVTINGDISGGAAGIYANGSSNVTVTGDVSVVDPAYGYNAISVATNASVTVAGNVTAVANSASVGARAESGGTITINGTITASVYIAVGAIEKSAADHQAISSMTGYLEYTDGTSFVWVKGTAASGLPATNDSAGIAVLAALLAFVALGTFGIALARRKHPGFNR